MITKPKIKVGKILWYQPARGFRAETKGYEVKVASVGRKWAKIVSYAYGVLEGRIDLETWIADGGNYSSPGRCYENEAEYRDIFDLCNLWHNLQIKINRIAVPPVGLTKADMIGFAVKCEINLNVS